MANPDAKLMVWPRSGYSLEPHPGMLVREPRMWKDCAAISMSALRACHRSSRHCPFSVYSSPLLRESIWYSINHAACLLSLQSPAHPHTGSAWHRHDGSDCHALQLPVSRKQAPHLTAYTLRLCRKNFGLCTVNSHV